MRNKLEDGTVVYQVELTDDDINEVAEEMAAGVFNGNVVNESDPRYKAMLSHARTALTIWVEENS